MAQQVEQEQASGRPRIWLVIGEKPGDNAQIMNLAEAVGWDYHVKMIFVKPRWVDGKPKVRPTLDPIDLDRSDSLEAPWPDLVITAGRRLSCVGLWIKRASAGKSRLVMIGKPRRMLDSVDLVIAASHYVMGSGPNVVRHDLPLMHVDPHMLENAAALWRDRLTDNLRPLTVLMVGGPIGGLRFDLETARDLFEKTLESVKGSGGSLYITTSRRTPTDVVKMLRRECPESVRLFEFSSEALASENPYHALLALADRFIVTTDSASMMVEVARLGRPLSIYPLEGRTGFFEAIFIALGLVRRRCPRKEPIFAGGLWARSMNRLGRPVHNRDLSAIPRLLVEKSLASWLGDEWLEPAPFVDDELEEVAERIRALVVSPGIEDRTLRE